MARSASPRSIARSSCWRSAAWPAPSRFPTAPRATSTSSTAATIITWFAPSAERRLNSFRRKWESWRKRSAGNTTLTPRATTSRSTASARIAGKRRARRSRSVSILRKYRRDDFDRLLQIDQACFVEGIAYSADEMRYFLSMPSAIILVAEQPETGAIQGFIIADRFRAPRTSRSMGRIITIDVAPQAQHSGLGTRLLTKAEEELARAG